MTVSVEVWMLLSAFGFGVFTGMLLALYWVSLGFIRTGIDALDEL